MIGTPRRHFPGHSGSSFWFLPVVPESGGVAQKPLEFTFVHSAGNERPTFAWNIRRWDTRGKSVIGKQYFVRQAAILFGIAKATKDPKISAAMMDKAADLKSKVDGPGAPPDLIPLAPDVEPPPAT